MNYWVNQFWDFITRSLNSPTYNMISLSRGVLLKKFGGWDIIVQKPWVPVTLFQTLELFNSDDFQGPIIENIPHSKPWFQQAQNFKKKTLKKLAPCILIQFMQGSTVFYPPLPSPPLPTERQKSIPEVSFNFTSSTGLWSFFKTFFADSSFGLSVVLSLFSIAEQPVLTRTSTGDMLMRDSNAVSRSLVDSFFIQRHPQAKSTTNERKDGLIEGRKSTKRWDFEELTEAIFQCNFTIVCRQCQTHRKTKVSGKLPK